MRGAAWERIAAGGARLAWAGRPEAGIAAYLAAIGLSVVRPATRAACSFPPAS